MYILVKLCLYLWLNYDTVIVKKTSAGRSNFMLEVALKLKKKKKKKNPEFTLTGIRFHK